jgi:hypothetical protein
MRERFKTAKKKKNIAAKKEKIRQKIIGFAWSSTTLLVANGLSKIVRARG